MIPKDKYIAHFVFLLVVLLASGLTIKRTKFQPVMLTKPPLLEKNDTVAIVAPAFWAIDVQDAIKKAIETFQAWGLEVVIGKSVGSKYNQFAGDDRLRTEDLQQMLDDPTIKAIFAYRGGYGTTRIIDQLDFTKFLQHPKWVAGFSDIATILFKLHQLGVVSIHGEMPCHFVSTAHEISITSLKKVLFRGSTQITAKPDTLNRAGAVAAPVVGGNLMMICANIGTKSDLDTTGTILVLEEIGEYLYSLDRMLGKLKRTGKLEHLAGLVVGAMVGMKTKSKDPFGKSAHEIIQEYVAPYEYPVGFNFPIGHEAPNMAFPHGSIGKLCVSEERATLTFD